MQLRNLILVLISLSTSLQFTLLAQTTNWLNYTNKNNSTCFAIEDDKYWIGTEGGVVVTDLAGEVIQEYTKADGLTDNEINYIYIDKLGNKWFATMNGGVSKFDGENWFKFSKVDDSVYETPIFSICEDKEGDIWAATNNGVSRYNGQNWVNYNASNSGLIDDYTRIVKCDNEGNIWVGTLGGDLNKFDGNTWTNYNQFAGGLINSEIVGIDFDNEGNVWVSKYNDGVYKYDGVSWEETTLNSTFNKQYTTQIVDSDGVIWLHTERSGVFKYAGSVWSFVQISSKPISGGRFNSMRIDSIGQVIALAGKVVFNLNRPDIEGVQYQIPRLYGEGYTSVSCNYNGDVFASTAANGAGLALSSVQQFYHNSDEIEYLKHGQIYNVSTVFCRSDGITLVGSRTGGYQYNGVDWSSTFGVRSGMAQDENGILWMGNGSGILTIDGSVRKVINRSNSNFTGEDIRDIEIDKSGNVWVATYDTGLWRFDGLEWRKVPYSSKYAVAVESDNKGNIWLASTQGPLVKYRGSDLTFINSYSVGSSGIKSEFIRSLYVDRDDNLWIGYGDKGITKYDGTTWTSYDSDNSPLTKGWVKSMCSDLEGNLWVATTTGLSVLLEASSPKKEKKYLVTGKAFSDNNKNGIKDNNEAYLKNQQFKLSPRGLVYTNYDDTEYRFLVDSGEFNILSYVPHGIYSLSVDTVYKFKATSDSLVLPDFAVFVPDTTLYQGSFVVPSGRCDSKVNTWYSLKNTGSTSGDLIVELSLDEDILIEKSIPEYDSINGNRLYYSYKDFMPNNEKNIRLELINPDFTRIDDTLKYSSKITALDTIIKHTSFVIHTCSYDPNEKTVIPVPHENGGYTLKNQKLEYTIHFQNLGNDTAFSVVVIDTLDKYLDLSTFEITSSSHPVNALLNASGIVQFDFPKIKLVDSTTNETLSSGFVTFKIDHVLDLRDYSYITNTGYIYFDKNPFIKTNTVVSRMVEKFPDFIITGDLSYKNENLNKSNFFPQPLVSSASFNLTSVVDNTVQLFIYNLNGVLIHHKEFNADNISVNREDFANSGLYLYKLKTNSSVYTGKICVQ